MTDIVLFGAGGLAREVLLTLDAINERIPGIGYNVRGFVVNEQYYQQGMIVGGYPVLGTEEWMFENKDNVYCVCAIGFPKPRADIQAALTLMGVRFISIVHPSVRIPESTSIGKGCVIQGGTTISADCVIGDGVFINTYCTVGHDAYIGDYTCIMPATGVSGNVKIGREVMIGGHAYIVPGRNIGDKATIAAGSVVFTNVKAGIKVLGNPAHRMECLEL